MQRAAALMIGILGGAGCSIPARDNPNDPTNRPDAMLTVSVEGMGAVNEGSRASVFVLDASGSSGPRDRELSFRWFLDLDSDEDLDPGEEFVNPPPCSGSAPPAIGSPCLATCESGESPCLRARLPISQGELDGNGVGPPGVGTIERTVGVEVASGPNQDVATDRVRLFNRAPVLDLETALFVPKQQANTLVVDACRGATPCSSSDPDGDLGLTWRWERLRPGQPAVVSTAASFEMTAPLEERAMLFRVTVFDDDELASASELVHVYITSVIWVTSTDPTRGYRVFSDYRVVNDFFPVENSVLLDTTGFNLAHGSIAADEDSQWVGLPRDQYFWVDPSDPFSDFDYSAPTTSHVIRSVPGPTGDFGLSGRQTWELDPSILPSIAVSNGIGCAAAFMITTTGNHAFARLEPGDPMPRLQETGGREPRFVHAAAAGNCWGVAGATDNFPDPPTTASGVYLLDEMAQPVFTPHLDLLDDVQASAVLDDESLWVAGRDDGGCSGGTRLQRYTPDGAPPTTSCLPGFDIDGLASRTAGGLFAHDRSGGRIYALDSAGNPVAEFESNTPVLLPNRTSGDPDPRAEPRMFYDRLEDQLWVVEEGGLLLRFSGDLQSFALADPVQFNLGFLSGGTPRFSSVTFDPRHGYALAGVQTPLHSGAAWIPAHMTRTAEVFVSGPMVAVSADPFRSGAWLADGSASDSGFRRIGSQGETLASVPPPGAALDITALGDGSAIGAWAVGGPSGGLVTIASDGMIDPNGPRFDSPTLGITLVSSEAGLICAIGVDDLGDGTILRGTSIENLVPAPSPAAPEDWFSPVSLANDGTACWAAFEQLPSNGEVARWDGVTVDRVPLPGARSMDVDPKTGDAWVATDDGSGRFLYHIPDETMVPAALTPGGDGTILVDVEYNDSCSLDFPDPECLILWIVRTDQVQRTDVNGYVREAFFLGPPAAYFDFDVSP